MARVANCQMFTLSCSLAFDARSEGRVVGEWEGGRAEDRKWNVTMGTCGKGAG